MASGSRCPMTLAGLRSIRRLTDNAITRFHPRKPSVPAGPAVRPPPARARKSSWRIITAQRDARHLVGQRDGRQFVRLAGEQLGQPRVLSACLLLSTDIAPFTSRRRRYPLPRLLIGPSLTLPPVPSCRGTRPSEAEKSRAAAKDCRVDHDRRHGARQDRPKAGNGDQMPAGRVAAARQPRSACPAPRSVCSRLRNISAIVVSASRTTPGCGGPRDRPGWPAVRRHVPVPAATTMPNSAIRPRKRFISMVRCLSASRATL